jgi:excisionase family DNA binding protein
MTAALQGPINLDAALRPMIVQIVREEVDRALAKVTRREEYLSPREAGDTARVAPGTVRRWIREGRLVGHRAGRGLRVRRSDLEVLLKRPRSMIVTTESPEALAARDFG